MNPIKSAAFTLFMAPSLAFAGPQYLDETGFAVSGYDVVAYWDLPQGKIGEPQPKGVPGLKSITAEYNGATWAFSTEENKARFLQDPAKYAPQYDGHCAYGAAQGGKIPGHPDLWRILDGKLYVNVTDYVVGFWEEDIPGNLKKSDANWVKIENKKANTSTIPNFTSQAPLGG